MQVTCHRCESEGEFWRDPQAGLTARLAAYEAGWVCEDLAQELGEQGACGAPTQEVWTCPVCVHTLLIREDGRVEIVCRHGVGHCSPSLTKLFQRVAWQEWMGVHGCDGCCDRRAFHTFEALKLEALAPPQEAQDQEAQE